MMEAEKRARKARAASSSDTESEPPTPLVAAASSPSASSSLGKRAQEESLEAADGKKPRVRKSKDDKRRKSDDAEAESDVLAADSEPRDAQEVTTAVPTDAEQAAAAVLGEPAQPVDMVITSEEAAGLNAAVAAAVEPQQVQEQVQTQTQAPPPKPRKGRRVRKTNLEKMEILAFVDQGGSQGAAAEKFGVSRTAVTKMVKERAAISAQALVESATSSRKVLQYQHKLSVIEDMLYKWQMQIELDAPALKITGDLLQSKAMEFRNKILADYSSELSDEVVMSLTDFKASNGWLHRYMQRRSMRSLPKQHGQAGVAALMTDRMTYDQRIQKIRDLLLTVSASCIWNLDELALRHRTTSARLDSVVNMDVRSLERISVMMAVSATGEKLHLQVVGKDPNPDSLKDVDTLSTYGIHYRDHCRASQDASTIADFIQAMNHEATVRKEVWYLVLDSCTAHVAAAHALNPSGSFRNGFSFDSIVLLFLPPGPSGDAQPLHQGVFRWFKSQFRREMLQTLLHEYEQWVGASKNEHQQGQSNGTTANGEAAVNEVFDVHAHTYLRNTMGWLQKAWESVPPSLIRQAWSACLFLSAALPGDGEAIDKEEEIKAYSELLERLTKVPALQKTLGLDFTDNPGQFMMDIVDFDKSEANGTDELAKDNEIVVESLAAQGLLRDTQRALVLESIKSDDLPMLTVTEANSSVSRLLHFMSQDSDNLLTLSERRTGRANLLILQRLLMKARERERERETTTDFTV
ncbi:tigger transposable element-derived protein 6-like [Phytophthora cinnamomi]|uniref:tigger transposable element-derived protein 6-like n=1 Tax=Phytophthora cinnamomi TaxID=4785 RepID=UPI003559F384|nr:tigger transposable element-derived protein 6-like [Phytophthora cinnamomi]